MNGLPYYKAYPRDFIEGTIGMSFEMKGAYRLILDLIYMQGGELPDDARYISGLLGCTVRKWNSLRDELVSMGKIKISGEFITNERAIIELESSRKLTDKQSENRSRPNKNKEIKSPTTIHTDTDTEATLNSVAARPPVDDLDILRGKLLDAVGEDNIQGHGTFDLSTILGMIGAGVSLEIDIIPTLKAKRPRMKFPARSWSFFEAAIRDAYERRVGASKAIATPADDLKAGSLMRQDGKLVPTTEARWLQRVTVWKGGSDWSRAEWGPPPGEVGCNVPTHLLQSRQEAA